MRLAKPLTLLLHPLTAGRDLDDPHTTALRRRIIREKPFLRGIYEEWYADIAADLGALSSPVVELGSGGGFMAECVPGVLTSDVMHVPGLDLIADASRLPFRRGSLGGLVMVNVLHHVSDPVRFFRDAATVTRESGRVVMIEPWSTTWSSVVYRRLHHEPFEPRAADWRLPDGGPLSQANSALPWIIFARDRARFERECPEWTIASIVPLMPFRYLLSGGVSMRSLVPAATFRFWRWAESRLTPWNERLAMFAKIVLVRRAEAAADR